MTPEGLQKIRKQLGVDETGEEAEKTKSSYLRYRNRLRRAYRYGTESSSLDDVSKPFDDGLMWLYFERRQDKM
jgi:hypothetical protein